MSQTPPLILVVDDDPSMGQALERLLGAVGFRVQVFSSAEVLRSAEALQEADCLVLDMHLPGEGGAACYLSLSGSRPPAVFISAQDGRASHRSALEAGAQTFLAKPFDGLVFLGAVERALSPERRATMRQADRMSSDSHSLRGANE
jgi:FixJ family two-component response regulator